MNYKANHTQPMLDNYVQSALNQSNGWKFVAKRPIDYSFGANIAQPPPEYEVHLSGSASTTPDSKSNEKLSSLSSLSRSHQDLSRLDEELNVAFKNNLHLNTHRLPPSYHSILSEGSSNVQQNMIEILRAENASLKNELENYSRKISKLQKFEIEIQKVQQAHEELIKSSEKKERLERTVRHKLEFELGRFQEQNKNLKEQMDSALATIVSTKRNADVFIGDNELKNEIQKRDVLITKLLSQNKELLNDKERQEVELQAQSLTLEEQRNHIEILNNALMNAQNNVVKLESELQKKEVFEERANQLQKALNTSQIACERRVQMEKKIRDHLEKDIECLQKQLNGNGVVSDEREETDKLRKILVEYEEKIISLEAEINKWETKCFEESAIRQIIVNATTAPKDAKIAALEKNSQQSEKMILNARTEKLKQMDALHALKKIVDQLEDKVKDLEGKLAEKEAMIEVLQQHSRDKDAVLQKSLLVHRSLPGRHTKSASSMGLTSVTNSATLISMKSLTSSVSEDLDEKVQENGEVCSSNASAGRSSLNSSLSERNENNGNSNKNIEEQLKELDMRLISRDSIIKALRSEKERYPSHFWRV